MERCVTRKVVSKSESQESDFLEARMATATGKVKGPRNNWDNEHRQVAQPKAPVIPPRAKVRP